MAHNNQAKKKKRATSSEISPNCTKRQVNLIYLFFFTKCTKEEAESVHVSHRANMDAARTDLRQAKGLERGCRHAHTHTQIFCTVISRYVQRLSGKAAQLVSGDSFQLSKKFTKKQVHFSAAAGEASLKERGKKTASSKTKGRSSTVSGQLEMSERSPVPYRWSTTSESSCLCCWEDRLRWKALQNISGTTGRWGRAGDRCSAKTRAALRSARRRPGGTPCRRPLRAGDTKIRFRNGSCHGFSISCKLLMNTVCDSWSYSLMSNIHSPTSMFSRPKATSERNRISL